MKYKKTKLSDVAEIFSGYAFKRSDLTNEGIPVLKIANIQNKRVIEQCKDFYPKRLLKPKHERYYLQEYDCLVAMTGAGSVGKIGKLWSKGERYLVNQRVGIIRPNLLKSDPIYIYYVLSQNFFEEMLYQFGLGAGQPNISAKDIGSLLLPLPGKQVQQKIAAILSAYDDLIENNLRRIKILEEMAQNLYREWFVNFSFPGYENTRFVDSPLGKIPEGWEVVSFTEIADVLSGGTPKTTIPEYWGGKIPFFAPKDTPSCFYVTETEKTITELGLKKCNSQLYPSDTVFITARGTVGNVVITAYEMAMNQSCYALRGKEGIGQKYLYMLMLNQVDYLKKNTGGATFSTIVVDTFRRMQIVKPTNVIIEEFEGLLSPLFRQMINMINRNFKLRQTRDLLLPKLISGEVDVSELDIKVPEEVAI